MTQVQRNAARRWISQCALPRGAPARQRSPGSAPSALVAFCSSVFIRVERAARRRTPRSASRIPRGGAHRGARREFCAEEQTEERVAISARRNLVRGFLAEPGIRPALTDSGG